MINLFEPVGNLLSHASAWSGWFVMMTDVSPSMKTWELNIFWYRIIIGSCWCFCECMYLVILHSRPAYGYFTCCIRTDCPRFKDKSYDTINNALWNALNNCLISKFCRWYKTRVIALPVLWPSCQGFICKDNISNRNSLKFSSYCHHNSRTRFWIRFGLVFQI